MTTIIDETGQELQIPDDYTCRAINADIDFIALTARVSVRFTNIDAVNARTFFFDSGVDGNVNGSIEEAAKVLLSTLDWWDAAKYEI